MSEERKVLDKIWEIIKDWYYSKPFIDVEEFYREDDEEC